MIPKTLMCICSECGGDSYSIFNQETNTCEQQHPQKTAFLEVGGLTYIFGCKECNGGQPYEDPYCQTCDKKFEKVDAPSKKTGTMKPFNYQILFTPDEVEAAQVNLESILAEERPISEEIVLSKTVCPHCIDASIGTFKTQREDLEMIGYFSNAPEGYFDESMYAPYGICQNSECIELEHPGKRWAMGVKLILRSELKEDVIHSEHYCPVCKEETKSVPNSDEGTYLCQVCSVVKSELSIGEGIGAGSSGLDFDAKSAYSKAIQGKSDWLDPPYTFSLAVNYHARAKAFDNSAKDKENSSSHARPANDWWEVLGPYLRPQYQNKQTETYESHVLLTAYLAKSSICHIEPLWLYSSKGRTKAGERKLRKSFEQYANNQSVFSSLLPSIVEVSTTPNRAGIESLVTILEQDMEFWPVDASEKNVLIERANEWCLRFIQSPTYQQYLVTDLLKRPFDMGGQINKPIGMIESFSILAALKQMMPEGKEIVKQHLYPKRERADWKAILNDMGNRFVMRLERLIDSFNA